MKAVNFDFFECQDCHSSLNVVYISKYDAQNISYGILSCKCAKYPVVEGILIFKKSKYLKQTIRYILQNQDRDALLSVIEFGSSLWKRFLVRFLRTEFPLNHFKNMFVMFIMKLIQPVYVNPTVSLKQAVSVWGGWGNYIAKRFSSKSFIIALPCLQSIGMSRVKKEVILDLCCGAGHFASKFEKIFPRSDIFCIDLNFVNLFFLKKYFSKTAVAVCCDANKKLPFKDGFFSMVFNSDSFHYLKNKRGAVFECNRLLKSKGRLLFSHLHNKFANNAGQGLALDKNEYSILFDQLNPIIKSERELWSNVCDGESIFLNKSDDEFVLDKSNAFVVFCRKN